MVSITTDGVKVENLRTLFFSWCRSQTMEYNPKKGPSIDAKGTPIPESFLAVQQGSRKRTTRTFHEVSDSSDTQKITIKRRKRANKNTPIAGAPTTASIKRQKKCIPASTDAAPAATLALRPPPPPPALAPVYGSMSR